MRVNFLNVFLKTLVFLLIAFPVFALQISEIQFDPNGTDTDREWIEVFNESANALDLTLYKFFENNTNHGLEPMSGDKNILSGEYVVIVQDVNKFRIDYPAYTGKIFKSSFSLSNSGEFLALKDKDGQTLHSVQYNPVISGAGNGSTLNFDGTNFVKLETNPGIGNLVVGNTAINNPTSTTTSSTSTQSVTTSGSQEVSQYQNPIYYYRSYFPESEKIYVYAGENQIGLSGATIFFNGSMVKGDKSAMSGNFFWNFGDGEAAEGKSVSHVYRFPGEYVVTLEGFANGSKNEDRIYVKISEPSLEISADSKEGENFIILKNKNKEQVDLGGYLLRASGGEFEKVVTLPKKLNLLPGRNVNILFSVLGIATSSNKFELSYPSGKLITENKEKFIPATSSPRFSKNILATSSSIYSSINVYTKENFEKLATATSAPKKSQIIKHDFKKVKYSVSTTSETISIKTAPENKIIVSSKNEHFLSPFLKLFGI